MIATTSRERLPDRPAPRPADRLPPRVPDLPPERLPEAPRFPGPLALLAAGIPLTLMLDLACCPDSAELYRTERPGAS